jgi:Transposase, Mutator family
MEEVRAWQARPVDPVHAVVFLDAIIVKVCDSQVVHNKPAYLAVGIDADGEKHVLGSGWPRPRRRPRHRVRGPGLVRLASAGSVPVRRPCTSAGD